jgi:RimJ/RimL family protein N-acetyltransferase
MSLPPRRHSYTSAMARHITQADLPIETERLTLRRFRISDAPALLALYGDPDVVRYLYSEPMQPDRLGEALFRRLRAPSLENEGDVLELAAVLRATGQFVGAMTFFHRSTVHARGELGYTLLPRFTGLGLAQEGAAALLHIGFDLLGLHRMEGQCDARNLASASVMQRIGMRQEAHFRENEFVKGEWTDAFVFAMLADEWAGREQGDEQCTNSTAP